MTPHAPHGAGDRRRRGAGVDAIVIAAASAVFAHLVLAAVVLIFDLAGWATGGSGSRAAATTDTPAHAAAAPLSPTCDADAILRAAARAAWCTTPFAEEDRDACLADVEDRMQAEFMLCHIDSFDVAPELVEPPTLAEIPQIDPEPLLEPLTPEELKAFEEVPQQVAMAEPPPPPPAPPPPPLEQQVIETAKPTQEEAPDDARFLAEYDSKVEKQEVARGDKHEAIIDKPKPEELAAKPEPKEATQPDEPPPEPEPGQNPEAPPLPGALSMRAPGSPDRAEIPQEEKVAGVSDADQKAPGDGPSSKRGDGAIDQRERKPVETARGEGGGGGGAPRAPNLRPDDAVLERVVGGGSVDHVEDIDEGDTNAFNTKRWVYASFFNRMKRQVAQNWNPASVWRREDPEGKHHGFKNRVTSLQVSLDATGKVAKIIIASPCGVPALDEEAVRAFHAAGPFPNPPAALVDRNGLITFEFGFHFSIDAKRTTWKVQRSL